MINTDCILWQTQLFVNTLAYFYLKAYLEAKPDILLSFMLINFLVWTLHSLQKLWFCICFVHKIMKKQELEIGKKIQYCPKTKKCQIHFWVFIVLGIKYNFVSSLQKIEEKKEK